MMKILFNIAIVVSVVSLGVMPSSVFAERGSGKNAASVSSAVSSTGSYCGDIDKLAAKIYANVAEQEKNYSTLTHTRSKELVDKRLSKNSSDANRRSVWDENRGEHFKLLESKAKNAIEKKVIASFKASIEKAVAARKVSIDASATAFQLAVDKVLKERRSTFAVATSSLKSSIDAAVAKAKAECSAKKSSNAGRDTFRASLKDAKSALELSVASLGDVTIDSAVKVRTAALEKAQKDFSVAVDKALKELKIAVPGL